MSSVVEFCNREIVGCWDPSWQACQEMQSHAFAVETNQGKGKPEEAYLPGIQAKTVFRLS